MESPRSDIQLLPPDVERDASFALNWFERPEGQATLISMGNAENEIKQSTLQDEADTLREFIELEKEGRQITRMIVTDKKTIGAVWIELFENHGVKSPSIHIMVGDPDYRGKGIGKSVMQAAIEYTKMTLRFNTIYSRHLANNTPVTYLNNSLGFEKDGKSYTDDNGLVWQNVKMELV
jgi:RimJ/RimL family protein N-acetyltransferase